MVIEKRDRGYCSARALGTEYAGGRQYTNFFADRAPLYTQEVWRVTPAIWG